MTASWVAGATRGDLTEPVTAQTERFVRTLWALDRDLAYARHYPAISWRESFSRDADALTRDDQANAARRPPPAARAWAACWPRPTG